MASKNLSSVSNTSLSELPTPIVKVKAKPKELSQIAAPAPTAPQHYLIHDNGGRPFKVTVTGDTVTVYNAYEQDTLLRTFKSVQRVFIGKSPLNEMTEFSGGYGAEFDGNSILLYMGQLKYVYIGSEIYSFRAAKEIVDYVSPVGNNDVPYPYGIDQAGKYYMMAESVVVTLPPLDKNDDPYTLYYDERHTSTARMASHTILVERQM